MCVVDGIPMTTVPRVLLDLAPSLEPADLSRACHEAWVHHRVTPPMIEACIARNPWKPRRRSNHIAYSYGDVVDRSEETIAELRELLA